MSRSPETPRDEVRELLLEAGPPPAIPAADLARIRNAAHKEFLAQSLTPIVEGRNSNRRLWAVAASLLLAVAGAWLFRSLELGTTAPHVAIVEMLHGEGTDSLGWAIGDGVPAGAEIDTGSNSASPAPSIAMRLASGHSIRLHADSKLHFVSAGRMVLERGAVYVDSNDPSVPGVEIETTLGVVREIGTQFEVRLEESGRRALRVRVREGHITVTRDGEVHAAERGEQLTVDDAGTVKRGSTPIYGDDWAWIHAIAPSYAEEDGRVPEFLEWYARETGLEVRFEDPSLELDIASVGVFGSDGPEGMTPEEALSNVLRASLLGYRIEGGTLVITGPSGR